MAGTPISIRLDLDTLERLTEAAAAAHRPLATHAAMLVRLGLSIPESAHLHAIWDLMESTEDDEGLVWAMAWLGQLLGIVQARHDARARELARFGRQMPEMTPC